MRIPALTGSALTRRRFVAGMGIGATSAVVLAACGESEPAPAAAPAAAPAPAAAAAPAAKPAAAAQPPNHSVKTLRFGLLLTTPLVRVVRPCSGVCRSSLNFDQTSL